YCILNQVFQQMTFGDTNTPTSGFSSASSVATPNKDLFPRASDLVQSELGIQTNFSVQNIDVTAFAQNSGLLNIAFNFNNLQGVKSVLRVDNQNATVKTQNSKADAIKYLTSLYSVR